LTVTSTQQLIEALRRPGTSRILVEGSLKDVPSITLLPGQSLECEQSGEAGLEFARGEDGIRLTCGNRVHSMSIAVSAERRVIFNDYDRKDAARLVLSILVLRGQVLILALD
jgi:hypothetical protein